MDSDVQFLKGALVEDILAVLLWDVGCVLWPFVDGYHDRCAFGGAGDAGAACDVVRFGAIAVFGMLGLPVLLVPLLLLLLLLRMEVLAVLILQ